MLARLHFLLQKGDKLLNGIYALLRKVFFVVISVEDYHIVTALLSKVNVIAVDELTQIGRFLRLIQPQHLRHAKNIPIVHVAFRLLGEDLLRCIFSILLDELFDVFQLFTEFGVAFFNSFDDSRNIMFDQSELAGKSFDLFFQLIIIRCDLLVLFVDLEEQLVELRTHLSIRLTLKRTLNFHHRFFTPANRLRLLPFLLV